MNITKIVEDKLLKKRLFGLAKPSSAFLISKLQAYRDDLIPGN